MERSVLSDYIPPSLFVLKNRRGGLECRQIEEGVFVVRCFTFHADAQRNADSDVTTAPMMTQAVVLHVLAGQQRGDMIVGFSVDDNAPYTVRLEMGS